MQWGKKRTQRACWLGEQRNLILSRWPCALPRPPDVLVGGINISLFLTKKFSILLIFRPTSHMPQERLAASRQVRIRIRSSLLMKCLSGRAPFTSPFSPSWDIQVLEAAALVRARRGEASFIAASRVRLGGSDAKRERKGRGRESERTL